MSTTVQTHQTSYEGGRPRTVSITNGNERVSMAVSDPGRMGRTIEALGLTTSEAAEIGRALLCAAMNVVEGNWGGSTDEDDKAIAALSDTRVW